MGVWRLLSLVVLLLSLAFLLLSLVFLLLSLLFRSGFYGCVSNAEPGASID